MYATTAYISATCASFLPLFAQLLRLLRTYRCGLSAAASAMLTKLPIWLHDWLGDVRAMAFGWRCMPTSGRQILVNRLRQPQRAAHTMRSQLNCAQYFPACWSGRLAFLSCCTTFNTRPVRLVAIAARITLPFIPKMPTFRHLRCVARSKIVLCI